METYAEYLANYDSPYISALLGEDFPEAKTLEGDFVPLSAEEIRNERVNLF